MQDARPFFGQLHQFITALETASTEISDRSGARGSGGGGDGGGGGLAAPKQKRAWIEQQIAEAEDGVSVLDRMMKSVARPPLAAPSPSATLPA